MDNSDIPDEALHLYYRLPWIRNEFTDNEYITWLLTEFHFRHRYDINSLTSKDMEFIETIPDWSWDRNKERFKELRDIILSIEQKIAYKHGGLVSFEISLLEDDPDWSWEEEDIEDWEQVFKKIRTSAISAAPPEFSSAFINSLPMDELLCFV